MCGRVVSLLPEVRRLGVLVRSGSLWAGQGEKGPWGIGSGAQTVGSLGLGDVIVCPQWGHGTYARQFICAPQSGFLVQLWSSLSEGRGADVLWHEGGNADGGGLGPLAKVLSNPRKKDPPTEELVFGWCYAACWQTIVAGQGGCWFFVSCYSFLVWNEEEVLEQRPGLYLVGGGPLVVVHGSRQVVWTGGGNALLAEGGIPMHGCGLEGCVYGRWPALVLGRGHFFSLGQWHCCQARLCWRESPGELLVHPLLHMVWSSISCRESDGRCGFPCIAPPSVGTSLRCLVEPLHKDVGIFEGSPDGLWCLQGVLQELWGSEVGISWRGTYWASGSGFQGMDELHRLLWFSFCFISNVVSRFSYR